jgi:uncharacterized protein YjbI with pentapeptide repeats
MSKLAKQPSKKQLQSRWLEAQSNHAKVFGDLKRLLEQPGLADLRNLVGEHDGRVDLRGIDLWEIAHVELSNQFDSVDFSHVKLGQNLGLVRSRFTNCIFSGADLASRFWGSSFSDCLFHRTQVHWALGDTTERLSTPPKRVMHYAQLGYDYEIFERCQFIKARFRRYGSLGAIHRHCLFDNCEFAMSANYIHSVFEHCKFKGKIRNKILVGFQQWPPTENTLENTMTGVDFSECELTSMGFYQQCDLSKIIPPDPATHCIYPATLEFADAVMQLGRSMGMLERYPMGQWPSFHGLVSDLYRSCGASREQMMQLDPERSDRYRDDEYFERHQHSMRYGLITPRDHVDERYRPFQEHMFALFVRAKQLEV